MKKLLVAAMGMAVAYGAFASPYINAVRFTGSGDKTAAELNGLARGWNETDSGTYIAAPGDTAGTNQYSIATLTGDLPSARPLEKEGEAFNDEPATELSVKTQFGKPLEFYVDPASDGAAKAIGGGLYFDSLVKFTVCDDDPAQEYSDAKIVMWLQEATNSVGDVVATNIMVKAGYLSKSGSVAAAPKVYVCDNTIPGDFDQNWHRVTIKAIADITAAGVGVPGFAIYIDGGNAVAIKEVAITDSKWDGSFDYALSEAAAYLNARGMLFPSLKQGDAGNKQSLVSVGFDGTGWLNDLEITDVAPDFAADHEANKATVVIGSKTNTFESIEEAINEINDSKYSGQTASLSLMKSLVLSEPIVFTGAGATTITLDFAGFVLTNELADAAITNNAASLTITNSVGNGGIYCGEGGKAIYDVGAPAALTIQGGSFWGNVVLTEGGTYLISGGSFRDDTNFDEFDCLADGKEFKFNEETQLYDVVDYVAQTCTITVSYGEHMTIAVTTNEVAAGAAGDYVLNIGDKIAVTYTAAAGYTLSKDSDSIASVSEDATIAAPTATPIAYAITYTLKTATGTAPVAGSYTVETASPVTLAQPAAVTGYTFSGWYDNAELEGNPVTSFTVDTAAPAAKAFYGQFTGKTFTIVTYTNGVVNTSKEFTYAGVSVDPADPLYDSATETWDNKWYTTDGGSTEFAFDAAGELTQNAYATIETKGGSSDWDDTPSAGEGKTAAEEYPALAGSALAEVDAPTLTTWAKANGVAIADVAAATTATAPICEAYLLNCAPADLEAEKAAFKLDISFDGSGNPVVTLPVGKEYNVTPTMKGSNDLSTWTVIDSTTGYQFFKYELSL